MGRIFLFFNFSNFESDEKLGSKFSGVNDSIISIIVIFSLLKNTYHNISYFVYSQIKSIVKYREDISFFLIFRISKVTRNSDRNSVVLTINGGGISGFRNSISVSFYYPYQCQRSIRIIYRIPLQTVLDLTHQLPVKFNNTRGRIFIGA